MGTPVYLSWGWPSSQADHLLGQDPTAERQPLLTSLYSGKPVDPYGGAIRGPRAHSRAMKGLDGNPRLLTFNLNPTFQKQRPEYEWPYSQPVAGWSSHGFRTHPYPDSTAAPAPNSPGSRVQSTARSASRAAPAAPGAIAGGGAGWCRGARPRLAPGRQGSFYTEGRGAEGAVRRGDLALSPPEPNPNPDPDFP